MLFPKDALISHIVTLKNLQKLQSIWTQTKYKLVVLETLKNQIAIHGLLKLFRNLDTFPPQFLNSKKCLEHLWTFKKLSENRISIKKNSQ